MELQQEISLEKGEERIGQELAGDDRGEGSR